jgi:23S rRNA (uracil1939-C5)-methyltransferase
VPDARLVLTIERLTFGFDALARHEGQVVFVPWAAPGDEVEAEVVERKRGYLRARLQSIRRPGPDRVAPPCPSFGTCGGCQWQHVAADAQRAAKTALVAEQLARLGGLRDVAVLPIRAAPATFGHRARITLAVEGRRLGYHRARSHTLVEVPACPIAAPVVEAHLGVARRWIERLRAVPERVGIAAAVDGVVLTASGRLRPGPADLRATESLLAEEASVRGAVLLGGGARLVAGDPRLRVAVEPDLALEVPADAFTQVHPEANLLLVAAVLELGAFAAGERVLDLYGGAGNFALPIARRGAVVTLIERSTVAVAAARANAERLGLAVTAVEDEVASGLAALPEERLDAVVLDPPRAGAPEAIPWLVAHRPQRIVYVSCDPATLARDARALVAGGYRLVRAQPIDLFPHTYHVETAAEFRLT